MNRSLLAAVAAALGALAQANESKIPSVLPRVLDAGAAPVVPPDENPGPVRRVAHPEANATNPTELPAAARTRPARAYPLYDTDEHGNLWVRGATYKASFGVEGATYVPFLGSDAPRNYPVRMQIASITAGGQPVELDASAPASRDGAMIQFQRGGVVEQYAIERETIEQRFVFASLPARGEVVVSIDVSTELLGRADELGLRFENERGHVRYGRAFALDAAGRRIGIESRLDAGVITLTVPADFVAAAEMPLTIDPVTGTWAVTASTDNQWLPDVAYEATSNAILVVYEDQYSATDRDVWGERYLDGVYTGIAEIDFTTTDWRLPKVAANNLANQFLCVAEVGVSPNRIIRGRTVSAINLAMSPQFSIGSTLTGDKHAPDVGGDPVTVGPTYYCVVWQRDISSTNTDINGRLVETDGTLHGLSTMLIDNSVDTLDGAPSISKTNGLAPYSTQNWTVLWEREDSGGDFDVWGARILWDGSITNSTFNVAATVENERGPVASDPLNDSVAGRPWLAAYSIGDPAGGNDLRTRAFSGTSVLDTLDFDVATLLSAGSPVISTDGHMWQIAYSVSLLVFPPDRNLWAAGVYVQGGTLGVSEAPVAIAATSADEAHPESASTFSSGNPYRTYVAWDKNTATNDYDVWVSTHDSVLNADPELYCFGTDVRCPCSNGGDGNGGCANSVNPNGARLGWTGTAYVSGDSFVLHGSGMPATSTCLYFQGTASLGGGTPFGDGLRCAGTSIRRLATRVNSGGSSATGYAIDNLISVRGAIPAIGGRRYYQAWYRNAAAFCSSSTFNLTNGVGVTWLP